MGKNKRFGIQGSRVSSVTEALKKEIHYVEKTLLYFNPLTHCLSYDLLCSGKYI